MIAEMQCGMCGVVWNVISVLWDSVMCNLYLNVVCVAWCDVECGRDVEWCTEISVE